MAKDLTDSVIHFTALQLGIKKEMKNFYLLFLKFYRTMFFHFFSI
jgi:hypothetical protein